MQRRILLISLLLVAASGAVLLGTLLYRRSFGWIERRSPALDELIAPGTTVERIAKGFKFAEGPVWIPTGHLLFGDLPNNVIWRWDQNGAVKIVRSRSGYADADRPPGGSMGSNGMALDHQGRLTVCEPGNRRITRTEFNGSITVLTDRYKGKKLNSPNDLVYRQSDDSLYFTDPPHGLSGEDGSPAKQLNFNGVYRLAGDELQLVAQDLTRPNGIAFSPDERYLYVSNSDPMRKVWMRYEVQDDGALANGMLFLDLSQEQGQAPDGIKVDEQGHLYLTGPGGLWIVAPTGEILGVLRTRQEPTNAAWGGLDNKTLFVTAPNEVYRIQMKVRGS